jgi:DNA phosphorothioation-dependent restriction protein DptG
LNVQHRRSGSINVIGGSIDGKAVSIFIKKRGSGGQPMRRNLKNTYSEEV